MGKTTEYLDMTTEERKAYYNAVVKKYRGIRSNKQSNEDDSEEYASPEETQQHLLELLEETRPWRQSANKVMGL